MKMKNIVIKIRDDEERKVIFVLPEKVIQMDLNLIKQGTFNLTWDIPELYKYLKETNG